MTSLVTEGLDDRIPHLYETVQTYDYLVEGFRRTGVAFPSVGLRPSWKVPKGTEQGAFRRHGDHIGIDRRNDHDAPPA